MMDDKQTLEDIRSVLWHIASALKSIDLKLVQLESTAHSLISISNTIDEFVDPFHQNSRFSRLIEVLESQSTTPKTD